MKIDAVGLLIAVAMSALLAYGIVSFDNSALRASIGLGAFISLSCTLAMAMGVSFDDGRLGTNVRTLAAAFFVGALGLNCLFAIAGFSQTSYIVVCGIFFLLYVLLANALVRAG